MTNDGSDSARLAKFPLIRGEDSDADAITAVIRRLASAHSLPEVMEIVTHAARAILSADGITFVLREGSQCYYAEEDAISPLWKGRRFPMAACISGWCMEHGRAVAIGDIYADERIPHEAYRPTFVKSLAMVPVRQEQPIAALGAYWSDEHQASAAELELLQTIANAAALSIAYVQLQQAKSNRSWFSRGPGGARRIRSRSVRFPDPGSQSQPRLRLVSTQAVIGLALATGAFGLRLMLDPLLLGQAPFTTFYAAIVLAVLWGGWLAGVTALVAGGLAAHTYLVEPGGVFSWETSALVALAIYVAVGSLLVLLIHRLLITGARERDLNKKLQLVRLELQHRIKNFNAVAQSLAVLTGRSSANPAEFEAKYTKRLQALGAAQALLNESTHPTAGLALLIERTLAPFRIGGQLSIKCPTEARAGDDVAVGIALILNELATNALKYGALTTPDGHVSIECKQLEDRIRVVWKEEGGPVVTEPPKTGFGSRLVRSAIPKGRGSAKMEYHPDGVRCRIDFVDESPDGAW